MNSEREMILQMLAESKITTSEAADLLDALETKDPNQASSEGASESSFRDARFRDRDTRRHERDLHRQERGSRGRRLSERNLEIHVQDGEETRTHVNIPLGLATAAGKFMPKKAQEYFEKYGIDLAELIDSVSHDGGREGELINVVDGETRVHIAIT